MFHIGVGWGGGGMMGVAVYGLFYASCMCVCVWGGVIGHDV